MGRKISRQMAAEWNLGKPDLEEVFRDGPTGRNKLAARLIADNFLVTTWSSKGRRIWGVKAWECEPDPRRAMISGKPSCSGVSTWRRGIYYEGYDWLSLNADTLVGYMHLDRIVDDWHIHQEKMNNLDAWHDEVHHADLVDLVREKAKDLGKPVEVPREYCKLVALAIRLVVSEAIKLGGHKSVEASAIAPAIERDIPWLFSPDRWQFHEDEDAEEYYRQQAANDEFWAEFGNDDDGEVPF